MIELSAAYNATEEEAGALWQGAGRPRGAAWRKIAAPVWDRQCSIVDQLAPLLLEWAEAERLFGRNVFGFYVVVDGGHAKLRARTGLKTHGNRIRSWLEDAAARRDNRAFRDKIAAMTDDEYAGYMADFCTLTPEGQEAKDRILREVRPLPAAQSN